MPAKRPCRCLARWKSQELRNCLRVIRYGIRGGASMLDFTAENSETQNEDSVPCERSANFTIIGYS
jgi:hypothetical protein